MKRASDVLKCLRELCRQRKLTLEVTRGPSVTVSGQSWHFYGTNTGDAPALYLRAHAAVLAKFPPIKPRGGARNSKAARAASRARLAAEQAAALSAGSAR